MQMSSKSKRKHGKESFQLFKKSCSGVCEPCVCVAFPFLLRLSQVRGLRFRRCVVLNCSDEPTCPLEKLLCLEALAYCLIADFSYGRTFTWKWEAMQICSSSRRQAKLTNFRQMYARNSETCELFVEKWSFKISSQWRICTCWCRLFRGLLRFADV